MSRTDGSGQDGLREAVEAFAEARDNENWRAWGVPQGLRALLAKHQDEVDVEALRGFAQWVASNRAYNGTGHKYGQALYNECVNAALPAWAEDYLAEHPATPTEEAAHDCNCGHRECPGMWSGDGCPELSPTEETAEVADEDREALADAMSIAMLEASDGYVQAHDEQWKRAADAILASSWLRDHDAALTANAKAEVAHWKAHAEEAGEGFTRVCLNYARVAAARTVAEAKVDDLHARLAKMEVDLAARADHVSTLSNETTTRTDAYRLAGKAEGLRIGANLLRAALANPDAAGEGK